MRRRCDVMGTRALAFVLLCTAAGASAAALQDGPAAGAALADGGGAVEGAAEAKDPGRAARLAEDLERCRAVRDAVAAFGHVDEFAAVSRKLLSQVTERFVAVKDGVFTDVALENWLEWNVVRPGAPVLPELDRTSTRHPYQAILTLNRQLRERGIDFLLVTFPTRPSLYPELAMELPSMAGFAGFCPATPVFLEALIEQGVEVLYLAPEFVAQRYGEGGDTGDQLYLRYNQHWTPRGADLAARSIAQRLARYPWFTPGPAREGVDWVKQDKEIKVAVVWGGTPEGAQPELMRATTVTRPDKRKADTVRPSSPIVLMSGSFADFHRVSDCDFTTQLYRHTGWQIDKVNPKGGVEDACREALAKKSAEEWSRKKIVIWMLAEQAFKSGPMWRPIDVFRK